MSGETNLATLLTGMSPQRRPGRFVFVTVQDGTMDADVLASVVEPEGLSVVVTQDDADRLQLTYDYVAGWITLQVHSALAAVGLTAAVSTALAEAHISCNVIAGYHHDHLLVPIDRLDDALDVLHRLAEDATRARATLRAEAEALAADPQDRAEAAQVLRDMENLRAW